jgi:hypothetical protein
VRELLKYSYPLPDRKGEVIPMDELRDTIQQYLVYNGPLAMLGYREEMFGMLREEDMPGLVEDIMQGKLTKAHECESMKTFNRLDHRMRVISDCVREAEEYLQEWKHLEKCGELGKNCSLTPEGMLDKPWKLLEEVNKAETGPSESSPERVSRSLRATLYHSVMEKNGIDYHTYLARRPALVGADVGFRAAIACHQYEHGPVTHSKQFEEFFQREDMLERLGEAPRRFVDRLEANTDPLQKAEALCRVFRQLRKAIAVQVAEIPKAHEDEVLRSFLARFNPPGLLTAFVYLYEFLFASFIVDEPLFTGIDLFVAPGASEHELKWLQRFLNFYFVRGPNCDGLFRLIRTNMKTYDVALFKSNSCVTDTRKRESLPDRTLARWLGLSKRPSEGLKEFVAEFHDTDSFRGYRVRASIFPSPARAVGQEFKHFIAWCDDQAELDTFTRSFRQVHRRGHVTVLSELPSCMTAGESVTLSSWQESLCYLVCT